MEILTALATGLLFATGIFLVLRRNIIRSAIGLIVLSSAVILFLLAAGSVYATRAAYLNGASGIAADALPQALILTAIVISMGGFAFVLAMLLVISSRYQTSDSDEIKGLKN